MILGSELEILLLFSLYQDWGSCEVSECGSNATFSGLHITITVSFVSDAASEGSWNEKKNNYKH